LGKKNEMRVSVSYMNRAQSSIIIYLRGSRQISLFVLLVPTRDNIIDANLNPIIYQIKGGRSSYDLYWITDPPLNGCDKNHKNQEY